MEFLTDPVKDIASYMHSNDKDVHLISERAYKISRGTVAKNIVSPKISKLAFKSDKRHSCCQRKYFFPQMRKKRTNFVIYFHPIQLEGDILT